MVNGDNDTPFNHASVPDLTFPKALAVFIETSKNILRNEEATELLEN